MSVTGPDTVRFDTAARSRSVASGNALGVASMFAWACGFPAADILLESWHPLALITARFALAVSLLMLFWVVMDGHRAVLSARWGRGTLMGGLTFGLGAYLLLVAQALTDAVTVAVIASATPVAATLIEMAGGGRRVSGNFVAGLTASVIGGVVATGNGDVGQLGAGALAATGSCFLFAMGSHFAVRDFPQLSAIGRSAITLAGGLIFCSVALFGTHQYGLNVLPAQGIDARQFGLLAVYALAGMALSQVMWIASVGKLGVAVASFHINVAPFYVMVLMLALGAGWDWMQALGAAIVIMGVVIAQRTPRQPAARRRSRQSV